MKRDTGRRKGCLHTYMLSVVARSHLLSSLSQVSSFQGGPLELSYWISHNLPLDPGIRQQLLEAPHAAQRFRLLLDILGRLSHLGCSSCGALLAKTDDVLKMTQEGIGGTFVNSHG